MATTENAVVRTGKTPVDPSDVVLELTDVVQTFAAKGTRIHAVNGVSLKIARGETVGLVGESGSGKTTVGRTALRLYTPTSGSIVFEGDDVSRARGGRLRRLLRRRSAMVFQNPSTSLNGYMRLGEILREPLDIHQVGTPADRRKAVDEILDRIGLGAAYAQRYPHELSGGQRQRVGIARALMLDPSLIVADEPTASLDVSVQAQIVNLLEDIQAERGLAYLFITHDLALVRRISHRIAVMYLGRIVELGTSEDLFTRPQHPYTASLASMELEPEHRIVPEGELPSPANPPTGCAFHQRCPIARPQCATDRPELKETTNPVSGQPHAFACHFPGELTIAAASHTQHVVPAPLPLVPAPAAN
ncbi:ABC transporter ATP-binding protein [Nocardioides jishulii]|uniref:ABC transporter ATP-binding protein n=1 Tax=Nocardioides jishulii TaxID=2575440 RepID=A0A4U2YHY6_9ACTN|nr:ABC transporter ATP-binding protein [Nocardioides jishulii]QCX28004.1 ABC transporter ATP-binding protein [Nocardioides jishulii]TKI60668.1 ABC transporter ATP-binding protein [Nocardioides jishulii]